MENKYRIIIFFLIFATNFLFAKSLEKITLQFQWKHQFEYAGFYIAKEKGYYKDVGLDVEFVEFSPEINIIDKVLSKEGIYGTTYANIVSEYLKGKPIVFVANFFKQSPLAIVTTKDIRLPSDLKGKKVMGIGNDINSAMMLIMFKKFGLTSNDFIHIPPSFNVQDFIDKKVDAMAIFTTNEIYYLNKAKVPYNLLNPTIYGAEFYDLNLFTSQEEVKHHPKRVKKFRDASIKGWEYALKHKDEVIELILKKYNTQHKTKDALIFEAKQVESIMLPNIYPIGSIDKNRIKLMVDNFKNLGFVDQNKTINYKDFIFRENRYNIPLTKEELEYLDSKKIIKVHNEIDWAPFNYNINGKAEGFSIDYMNLIAKKIGIKIEYVHGYSWNEFIKMLKDGSLDVMLNIVKTPKREKFLSFTSPYKEVIDSVVTREENAKKYKSLNDFNGKILAVIKGFSEEELIQKYYPKIKVLLVNNTLDGLKAVAFNEADGFMNTLGVLNYTIQKYNISNLKPAFDVKNKHFSVKLRIATNKQQEILRDILQKGINNITEQEKNELMNKWFMRHISNIDYMLIIKIISFTLLIIIFVIVWNIKLKQKVNQEIEKNRLQETLLFYYNKQESMKNIVNNIAHQWKAPLNELSSWIMLLDSKLFLNQDISKDELKRITKLMKGSIQFMTNTIDTFNNFYKDNDQKEYFSIEEAIDETLEIIHNSIEEHNITIYKNIEKDLRIIGNKNQLEQVLLTLFTNAQNIFKERNIQNPTITIDARKEDKFIIITVKDNGGGIDGNIEDIFTPTISKTKNSSGFGLFIAKNIIQTKFNGEINAKNILEGAVFNIKIK
ncbi:ABC-type nitrate/sulfonate/bicarbonate transport system, substrate-binding protein [Hydrogenimonas thermophila]|uniref:Thiamine pyrimidine synthase n=1 Tax=Hydrogenimonas thermophila TaxID=223786 RepID=A0A1I5M288_9BACT|nr:ABC-type nitrate/sulfonate/bicarbonate transport system, substrate-binding protein [Hydrogenimonas thermophila]